MNVAHLAAIVAAYLSDLERSGIVAGLSKLTDAINNLASDASEENQRVFVASREELRNLFKEHRPFQYPRTWQSSIAELGLEPLTNGKPLVMIEDAIDKNQMALVTARDIVQKFQADITKLQGAFTNVVNE